MIVLKNRLYAFSVHLSLSLIIGGIALLVVFLVWYPKPFDAAIGVGPIFLMLLGVDIVIGPTITCIIYKPNKPSLKFDLTVIALLQLAALTYGMHTIFEGRPAFIVFSKDRFEIARASDLDSDSVGTALRQGNQLAVAGWGRPHWVGALPSADIERNNQITFSAVQGGPDWPLLPELYVPLTQVKADIIEHAQPLQALRDLHKNNQKALDELANFNDSLVKWLPLRGKVNDLTVLVDADSGEVLKVVDIKPWPDD